MPNPDEIQFALEEYKALWAEWGIELPKKFVMGLRNRIETGKGTQNAEKLSLEGISKKLGDCKRCTLCKDRNSIVFGEGNSNARIMFVGEGPGADEDRLGRPFVGRAGQMLDKIITAMGFKRDELYIANIVKCRPPQNRVPSPEEIAQCSPFLRAQIATIQPKIIVALGSTAATTLTGQATSMGQLRGRVFPLVWDNKLRVIPTYHPAYLLRNPDAKKLVWEDMKVVKNGLM